MICMKIVDLQYNEITSYNENFGTTAIIKILKPDAVPIDNVSKFQYTEDDYEEVLQFIPYIWARGNLDIETVRNTKLTEMSETCNTIITNGVTVNGETFSMETTDQINMLTSLFKITSGESEIKYHANGESCRYFTAEEFTNIANQAIALVEYHQSYYNSLRNYIMSLTTVEDIASVKYGMEIPEEFQTDVLKDIIQKGAE